MMSREAFEILLAPHLPWIRTLIVSRSRMTDHTDDLVQQTLMRAYASRDQLSCPSKFRNWVWSIAVNEIRMFLRRRHSSVSLDELPIRDFADWTPSPLARYEQLEREGRIQAGMARLATRHRIAIRLVDLEGLSYSEAATVLAVSTAAFKSIHYRALQALGRSLRATSQVSRVPRRMHPQAVEKTERAKLPKAA